MEQKEKNRTVAGAILLVFFCLGWGALLKEAWGFLVVLVAATGLILFWALQLAAPNSEAEAGRRAFTSADVSGRRVLRVTLRVGASALIGVSILLGLGTISAVLKHRIGLNEAIGGGATAAVLLLLAVVMLRCAREPQRANDTGSRNAQKLNRVSKPESNWSDDQDSKHSD